MLYWRIMAGLKHFIILVFFLFCAPAGLTFGAVAQTPPGNAAFERGDFGEALEIFRSQAAEGEAISQYNLGIMYLEGLGTDRDFAEAARWLRRAADQGLSQAQYELGKLHAQGRGVGRDYEQAVEWWRKAAVQGDARAQHHLGVQYSIGIGLGWGLSRDDPEAVRWWKMAARQGYAPAQYELGRSYLLGRGVERDRLSGMMWLILADEQNGTPAHADSRFIERQKQSLSADQLSRTMQRAENCRQSDFQDCD